MGTAFRLIAAALLIPMVSAFADDKEPLSPKPDYADSRTELAHTITYKSVPLTVTGIVRQDLSFGTLDVYGVKEQAASMKRKSAGEFKFLIAVNGKEFFIRPEPELSIVNSEGKKVDISQVVDFGGDDIRYFTLSRALVPDYKGDSPLHFVLIEFDAGNCDSCVSDVKCKTVKECGDTNYCPWFGANKFKCKKK